MKRGRLVWQGAGFAMSLALLAWFVRLALGESQRGRIETLASASWVALAAVGVLSVGTIALNGLVFWATLRPHRRICPWDTQAINAIAYLTSYLPFKISVVSRVVLHHRRDRLPLATIGAWLAAVGIVALGTVAPLGVVGWWRQRADALWAGASLGAVACASLLIVQAARVGSGQRGRERVARWLGRAGLAWAARTRLFREAHAGLDMLADARAVAGSAALRLVDVGVQAARFWVVADLAGTPIAPGTAVLFASIFFLVGALSPFGVLGAREGVVVVAARAAGVAAPESMITVALAVTAAELMTALAASALGVAWLGPHRLLLPAGRMIAPHADRPGTDQPDGGRHRGERPGDRGVDRPGA